MKTSHWEIRGKGITGKYPRRIAEANWKVFEIH